MPMPTRFARTTAVALSSGCRAGRAISTSGTSSPRARRMAAPSGRGSIAAYELGEQLKNFDLPHCVAINEPGMGAGFLGMSFSPFVIQNPNAPIANLKPPADVDAERFDRRLEMLGQVENDFIAQRRNQLAVDHKAVYGKTIRMM